MEKLNFRGIKGIELSENFKRWFDKNFKAEESRKWDDDTVKKKCAYIPVCDLLVKKDKNGKKILFEQCEHGGKDPVTGLHTTCYWYSQNRQSEMRKRGLLWCN